MTEKCVGKHQKNISNEEEESAFENATGKSEIGKSEVEHLHDR